MSQNEFSGKSVDEAIEKGLAELGVARDAITIEIVREASRGLLGLGGEDARVRLTRVEAAPVAANDVASIAQEMVETILREMGFTARVEILPDVSSEDEDAFVLNILGEDLGVLIGRRGETLRDLEYLARLMVTGKTGKSIRFIVDVEGYRTRRERQLRDLAQRMAARVEEHRQPVTLEAMPPNERRIVHIALRDHPRVKTHSIGEGDHRRVMILPQ
jgi:spoIIIJ-associated protein